MDKKYKLVQKVPKTPKNAYNHGRFISSLIEHQLKHFNEVERHLLKPGERLTDVTKLKTELAASKYLQKMTARVHAHGAEQSAKATPPGTPKKAAAKKAAGKQSKRKSR